MCTRTDAPAEGDGGDVQDRDGARDRAPADAGPETFYAILPVLFVEFLAIAVTKSLLPSRLNDFFGDDVYAVIGVAETVKGALAFCACPLFGKLSDDVGRVRCLLFTVVGTTAPCWVLAFTDNLWVYVCGLALSGAFASTFTLAFAYVADVVPPKERAPAYGLCLATLGLSFTVGPVLGAAAARRVGDRRVFLVSAALAAFGVFLIVFALPESNPKALARRREEPVSTLDFIASLSCGGGGGGGRRARRRRRDARRVSDAAERSRYGRFDPLDALSVFRGDPFLRRIAVIVLLYYSGVWALVTTVVVYAVRVFRLDRVQVGSLLSLYGLSTMVAEGVLVRVAVPALGELRTARLGLLAFAGQCSPVLESIAGKTAGLGYLQTSLPRPNRTRFP